MNDFLDLGGGVCGFAGGVVREIVGYLGGEECFEVIPRLVSLWFVAPFCAGIVE